MLCGLAAPQLSAALGFGVGLGSEQERGRGQPEPDEHDDDPGERAPGLVVGPEHAHVHGEEARGGEPDQDGDDRARRDEGEFRMVDVRAEVENARESDE